MRCITVTNIGDLSNIERRIMLFVDYWAINKKTIIPRTEIFKQMLKEHIKAPSVKWAVNDLIKKQFIRRSCLHTSKTYYVQLRRP